ncbi:hypothetical protein J6590_091793 [Homalodisca vitripennis]|nr:hypothetical protein J6590_091793 [Homalodisca vitripennis]
MAVLLVRSLIYVPQLSGSHFFPIQLAGPPIVPNVFDDTDVDPTYRPTISDSDDEEMPFSQLSTSRGNAAARPTPDQPASVRSRLQNLYL